MSFRAVGLFCVLVVSCVAARAAQPPEFRALWADTFHAGLRNSNDVTTLLATARNYNFNAVIVEVRKRCDAYYNSTIEPKATDVSPQSYDPLADLIARAHTGPEPIEVHAWITTYLVWNNQTTGPSQVSHPYYTKSNWFSVNNSGANWDGSNYQFDQALPEVQRHVYSVAMDIISRYEVDGFHFDYVRYSGNTWGYHSNALSRFNSRFNRSGAPGNTDAQWLQFRRDQVSDLVRKVYLNAIAVKPQIKMSGATICFAPGVTSDASWFSSSAAWNNVLQDWRGWMAEGILDLNVPMMYFRQPANGADWAAWSIFAKEHTYGRQVALGQGSYLNGLSNVLYQLRTTRVPSPNSNALPAGIAMYSYAVPVDTTDGSTVSGTYNALINGSSFDTNPVPLFAEAVPTPEMTWKTSPTVGHLKGTIRSALTSNELDGAFVSITGPRNGARTNDATGFYGFAHLPPGTYTVTASYSNLTSQSQAVIITTGTVATLDFYLAQSNSPIANIRVHPGLREALVAWNTAAASDSQVEFGPTAALGSLSLRDVALVTNHVVLITGLQSNSTYSFRVISRNATATNISSIATFTTAGEIIIDNTGAALTGSWTTGTSSPDKYGNDYNFLSVTAAAGTATYTPNIATPGPYDVYVWYPEGANRSTNAPWTLVFNGGTTNGGVNQTTGGGGWRLVAAAKQFARGTSGYFQWQNQTPETSKVVMADAVRFVYVGQEPPPAGTIPQWWAEFFAVTNSTADADTDRFSAVSEYLAGTDPTRAASMLKYGLLNLSNNVVRFSFTPFHDGRIYQLQSQSVLSTNGWTNETVLPQRGASGEGIFSITNSAQQKFFKLRVTLPP